MCMGTDQDHMPGVNTQSSLQPSKPMGCEWELIGISSQVSVLSLPISCKHFLLKITTDSAVWKAQYIRIALYTSTFISMYISFQWLPAHDELHLSGRGLCGEQSHGSCLPAQVPWSWHPMGDVWVTRGGAGIPWELPACVGPMTMAHHGRCEGGSRRRSYPMRGA